MAPLAHVAGLPIEETIGAAGPGILAVCGLATAWVRSRLTSARAAVGLEEGQEP